MPSFEDSFNNACGFDQLVMITDNILLLFHFYSFVDWVEEYQDGESKKSDQNAHYLEEILIYLKVIHIFYELGHFLSIFGELLATVKLVMDYFLYFVAHLQLADY